LLLHLKLATYMTVLIRVMRASIALVTCAVLCICDVRNNCAIPIDDTTGRICRKAANCWY